MEVYTSHVWLLLSVTVYLVRKLLEEHERIAGIVEMERAIGLETSQVTKGLPRTRKKRRLEEGKSNVTLRSLKEDIRWLVGFCEAVAAEMVRSGMKVWKMKEEVAWRDG